MPKHREHDLPGDRWCFKSRRDSTFDRSAYRKKLLAECHRLDAIDALLGPTEADEVFAEDSIQETIDSQKIMSELYHQQLAIRYSDTVWTSDSDPVPSVESREYCISTRFKPEPDRWINLDPPRIRVAQGLWPAGWSPFTRTSSVDFQKFLDSLTHDLSDY